MAEDVLGGVGGRGETVFEDERGAAGVRDGERDGERSRDFFGEGGVDTECDNTMDGDRSPLS